MLRKRLFLYLNALTYNCRERRAAMELRLFIKASRLRIGTLTLDMDGSRRAPQADGAGIRVFGTAVYRCLEVCIS